MSFLFNGIGAKTGRSASLKQRYVCHHCLRFLSMTASRNAGHNKWSKTKHIKAVTDKKKMTERAAMTRLIAMYSRMYGDDIKFNPQLANAVTAATKASVPKALIENAIAKGQGRSPTGAQLEPMTMEFLVLPDIALMVDAETDNKMRTLQDMRDFAKKNGAVSGSTAFYFTKRGKTVFKQKEDGPSLTELLDEAIEHEGVQDVEELSDGDLLAWTEPAHLTTVTKALADKFELEVLESDLIWAANEDTIVNIDASQPAEELESLVSGLSDFSEVKAIYANIRQGTIDDERWERIERNIDV